MATATKTKKTTKKAYESKAVINKITATSRMSIKINDNFYTIEYSEERLIPDVNDIDVIKERELLWEQVNSEVDNQIEDIYELYKK